ncbi:MAG: hypothetical protein PF551_06450 [Candidatus Marinimicrobia bacterium]|nr:hypothetical protein [Candidatus Neomarinimicrobiota bacterium]
MDKIRSYQEYQCRSNILVDNNEYFRIYCVDHWRIPDRWKKIV